MDIVNVIRQLKEEKARLDRTISALEAIWAEQTASLELKRKGRKAMPESERKDVSRRMRQYWAAWRKERAQQTRKRGATGAGKGDPSTGA